MVKLIEDDELCPRKEKREITISLSKEIYLKVFKKAEKVLLTPNNYIKMLIGLDF